MKYLTGMRFDATTGEATLTYGMSAFVTQHLTPAEVLVLDTFMQRVERDAYARGIEDAAARVSAHIEEILKGS